MPVTPEPPTLLQIHNNSARTALIEIVKPTLDAGGTAESVLVVLESVVTGVLLAIYPGDPRKASAMLEEALVPAVIERLAHGGKAGGTT